MELENHTAFPAMLYRTSLPEKDGKERLAAAVIARVTYDLTDWGSVPRGDQVWKLSGEPWEGPHGPMDGDEVFFRGGVDVFVFGRARKVHQPVAIERVDHRVWMEHLVNPHIAKR